MRIAEIIGTVTLSRTHPTLVGARWLIGVPFSLEGLKADQPDGEDLVIAVGDVHEKSGVRRPRHAAQHRDVAAAQQLPRPIVVHRHRRTRQFQRGQICPSGFIGKSHNGQCGRPPSTAATPLRIITLTCARVA